MSKVVLLLLSAPVMTYGRHDNRLVSSTNVNRGKSDETKLQPETDN